MKSLARNSFFNVLYKCTSVVFPLIMAAYVSRILSPVGVGKVASAQNIVTYFTLLAALGLPTYGTQRIAATKDREELSKTFFELFCINAVSTTVCSLAYYIMIFSVPYFAGQRSLYAVTGLLIVFNYINVDWFYQGREEYQYIMIRSLLIRIGSLVAAFLFVKTADDYVIYALLLSLSKVANYVFNTIHLKKYISISFKNLEIKKHLKPVFILLAASLAIEVYTLADTTMLSFFRGDVSVGYYSTAMKAISVARMFITSIVGVFLPRLSYYYSRGDLQKFIGLINRGFKILLYLTIPAAIGVFMVAYDMTLVLYGAEFLPAVTTTKILSISIISVGFSNFIGYQILVTIKKEKLMFYSTLVGAVVNICLNFFLISILDYNGAAIASVITELCVTCVQLFFIRKEVKIEMSFKFLLSLLCSNVVLIVVVMLIQNWINTGVIRLVFSVLAGAVAYLLISVIFKNEVSYECVALLRNKIKKKEDR